MVFIVNNTTVEVKAVINQKKKLNKETVRFAPHFLLFNPETSRFFYQFLFLSPVSRLFCQFSSPLPCLRFGSSFSAHFCQFLLLSLFFETQTPSPNFSHLLLLFLKLKSRKSITNFNSFHSRVSNFASFTHGFVNLVITLLFFFLLFSIIV